MATFTAYTDSGHGWARVPRKLLVELGIADKITPFSFQRGEFVYLEEDCDLSTFVDAYRATGKDIKFKSLYTHKRSKIRSYDHYYHS